MIHPQDTGRRLVVVGRKTGKHTLDSTYSSRDPYWYPPELRPIQTPMDNDLYRKQQIEQSIVDGD